MIDLSVFALQQHVVIVITRGLLNSLLFKSFFELISCNDMIDDHHAHGLLGICKHVCALE